MIIFRMLFVFLYLHGGFASAAEPGCVPLPIFDAHPQELRGLVIAPGRYCLQGDITAVQRFDIHAGGFKSFGGQGLISIACSDRFPCGQGGKSGPFSIDLQNHNLIAEAENMIGVENSSGPLNVTVRNGRIRVPGRGYPNRGIYLRSQNTQQMVKGEPCTLSTPGCEDLAASETDGKRGPVYEATGYVIDTVDIRAGWRGVHIGGAGTVLRNSVIEVDGSVAVYQLGPGAVIENNTFIIHGKGERRAFDAVLKLRDAHGAIVRNNTFVFRGGIFSKAPAAINLLDSSDVLVTGNRFKGFDKIVRVNGTSTYTQK